MIAEYEVNITLVPNQQESLQAIIWVVLFQYNTNALSAAVITGYGSREVCRRFVSNFSFWSGNLFSDCVFS